MALGDHVLTTAEAYAARSVPHAPVEVRSQLPMLVGVQNPGVEDMGEHGHRRESLPAVIGTQDEVEVARQR